MPLPSCSPRADQPAALLPCRYTAFLKIACSPTYRGDFAMPHSCLTRRLFLVALALFFALPGLWGQSAKKTDANKDEKKLDLKVTLRFSVTELDPENPGDSYVECIVHNHTQHQVRVPANYVGGYQDRHMVLQAKHRWPLTLVYWAGEKQARSVRLDPGKDATVFKAPLKELLLLGIDKVKPLQPSERRVYWSWSA